MLDDPDQQGPASSAPAAGPADASSEGAGSGRWLVGLSRPVTGSLLLGAASAAVWTCGRSHLVSAGTSETGSVLAWIAIGVGGTATALTARPLSGLAPATAWVLTTGVAGAAVAGLAAPDRLTFAIIACAVFGWGFLAATSALITWTGLLAPVRAAAAIAVAFVALVIGQAIGSSLAGVLSARMGLATVFVLAALTTALAASCGLRLRRTESSPAVTPVGSPPARTR